MDNGHVIVAIIAIDKLKHAKIETPLPFLGKAVNGRYGCEASAIQMGDG